MMILWLALAAASGAFLLLPWVVYPALTYRRAATKDVPAAEPASAPRPTVAVVLVTKESPERVRARLENLLSTAYPAELLEIIVSLDGVASLDGLEDLAGRCRRLQVVRSDPPGGKACGLNSAVRASEAEVLVFADTHQRFEQEAIPRLVASIAAGPWMVVSGALHLGGPARAGSLLTRYWEAERRLREAEARIHSSVGVTGAIYAMRSDRWEPLPAGLILDDLYLPMRRVLAGDRVGFEPTARAHDLRQPVPAEEFRRKVRTLTGNFQLCAWLPGVLRPGTNPVWSAFVCHKLLRLLTPYCIVGGLVGGTGLVLGFFPSSGRVLLAVAALMVLAVVLGRDRVSRSLRSAAIWGVTMQAAAVLAALNGIRGNWDVWRSPPKPVSGSQ